MTVIFFVIALGILVTIHEWGHYIMAKRNGMKVEEFAVGFGPKIFGMRRGETEYKVCIIPLGGYVKILGQDPTEEGADDPRAFINQSVWSRLKVVLAGPTVNIFFCFLIMPLVFLIGSNEPSFLNDKPVVDGIRENTMAAAIGFQKGDTLIQIDNRPIATWRDVAEAVALSDGNPLTFDVERRGSSIQLQGRADSKPAERGFYLGIEPFLFFETEAVVNRVVASGPAKGAGLESGDIVTAINGKPIATAFELTEAIHQSNGKLIQMQVLKNNRSESVTLTPEFNEEYQKWMVGIGIQTHYKNIPSEIHRYGITDSIQMGFDESLHVAGLIGEILKRLVRGEISYKALGGPFEIARASAEAAQRGISDFVKFLAFLSMNLGILNLLPIPILDGGHVFFLGIESIRRRPLNARAQSIAQQVGFIALISIMIVVTFNDLENIWGIKSLIMSWF